MKKIIYFFTIFLSFIFINKSSYANYKKVPNPILSITYDIIPENSKYIDILVPELTDYEYYISIDKPTYNFSSAAEIINYKDSDGFISLTFNYKIDYEFDSLIIDEEGNEISFYSDGETVNRFSFDLYHFNYFKIAFLDENGDIVATTNKLEAIKIFEYTYKYCDNQLTRYSIYHVNKRITRVAFAIILAIIIAFIYTIIMFIANLNTATIILRLDTKKKYYYDRLTIVLVSVSSTLVGFFIVALIYNIYLNIKMKKALKELKSNV